MDRTQLASLLAAVFATAFLIQVAAAWWRRLSASRRARRRGARAVQGEREAELLLDELGYRVIDRQISTVWTIQCDGESLEVDLRADLLVTRDGRRYVAEVKTGDYAPQLSNAATRRQLLEYRVAYDVDSVLLVDVEAGHVQEVIFPI